jgi:hypothetical protein
METRESQLPEIRHAGTGSHEPLESFTTVDYPFDRYTVRVQLSEDGKFIGIVEIRLNTDFMDYRQKIATLAHEDVEKYYQDEPTDE